MPKSKLLSFLCALLMSIGMTAQTVVTMTIDAQQKGPETSPYQYGLFFEEINHAGDGGLYAELIRNRSFEDVGDWPENWWTVGDATFGVTTDNPLNTAQQNSLWLTINSASEDNPAGVANEGFWGMNIVAGRTYHLTFFMRQNEGNFTGRLLARLLSEDRSTVCGEAVVQGQPVTGQWVKLSATITATSNDPKGWFALVSATKGQMQLDVVSLFPPTWKDRPNGLRSDLAQLLADTHPSFLRFPGGCYVEGAGDSYENAFQWKRTIGPIEQRPGHWNYNWGYRSSDGLGFDEYLQLCEDLGAAPMFVINVGLGHNYFIPLDQMQPLVQDALDAIEYANGDASTTWGARRIANGHAEPYNLKFIEIGNENYQSDWDVEQPGNTSYQYPERYEMFRQAISSRYPDIILIGNVEAWGTGSPTWRNKYPVKLVDEHYYRHYSWMQQNYHKYDSYDRSLGINVYNGEYAANGGDYGKYGNVNSALGEAVYMLGMERNSDVCRMASFAPIFMHENNPCWSYDMIHFNAAGTFCTPSYYVQQLLPEYLGKQNLLWTDEDNVASNLSDNYHAGVATWNTAASFKDFTVTDMQGNTLLNDNFASGTANWSFNTTGWQTADDMLQQHEIATDCRAVNLTDINSDNYIVRLKARKEDGAEGFLIIFNYQDEQNFCWWNLGGWENKRHGVEWCNNGDKSTIVDVTGSIEQGRWYDVEIQVNGSSATCKLDGQVVHQFTLPIAHHIYQSVQLSEDGNHLFVKAVNPGRNAVTLNLKLKNMQATGGRTVVLKGLSGTDENTMEQPNRVVPTEGGVLSSDLSNITLPPYSLNILDIDVTDEQNAPIQGEDLTTWVDTSQEAWNAWLVCATEFAPAITTSDGRQAQMMETYEGTTEETGELMWQEVTGLPNGDYVVEVFANAVYTPGRGFESSVVEGAEDVVYVEANGQRTYLEARIGESVPWNGFYRINTTVTDGKLRISMVAEKPGTNWHTIQIKRLVRLISQDEDLTAHVETSQDEWNAWLVCATEFAPAITTNDGRQAQMMETYEETTETTGELMHQTVTGLENGDYAVELYANAQYTDGRDFASDLKDGATDVVYVSANDRRCYVTAHIGTAVSENGVYTVYAHVTDGTLRLGLTAEKPGTNWHTIQIKKLTLLRQGTVIYADDMTREQGQDNPKWTYTLSGAGITGQPSLICTANKQSPAGSYVISIGKGTTKSDLPIYLQPGVLTVTVPTGIEEIGNDEANAPVYDLQGRRVEGAESGRLNFLRPGFYIRGGKIIHVKR